MGRYPAQESVASLHLHDVQTHVTHQTHDLAEVHSRVPFTHNNPYDATCLLSAFKCGLTLTAPDVHCIIKLPYRVKSQKRDTVAMPPKTRAVNNLITKSCE